MLVKFQGVKAEERIDPTKVVNYYKVPGENIKILFSTGQTAILDFESPEDLKKALLEIERLHNAQLT